MTPARFPNAPPQIASLPVDARGFPVPWFVPWIKGEPEFRAVERRTILKAHREGLCWICGRKLGTSYFFVIGPMCAVNRTSAEPPSHLDCARFAVEACPFLSRPLAKRADVSDLEVQSPGGIMIDRNPGVTLIWGTRTFRYLSRDGIFKFGSPHLTEWYAQGRRATRAEVTESVESGLPILAEHAKIDGANGLAALRKAVERIADLIPEA